MPFDEQPISQILLRTVHVDITLSSRPPSLCFASSSKVMCCILLSSCGMLVCPLLHFSGMCPAGKYVEIGDTIKGFKGIMEGKHDDLPEMAFYMVGDIKEVQEKADKMAKDMAEGNK